MKRHLLLPLVLAAAIPALSLTPAQAQDRPNSIPTRDVAVTYRVSGEGAPAEMRMAYLSAQRLMRMDMPGGQGHIIVNTQSGGGFMVMPAMRMIMDLPAGQGFSAQFSQASATARFTREGADRVANLPCTIWRVEDRGEAARVCSTADGVMLRTSAGGGQTGRGQLEAMQVEYTAQDASRFARPSGYQSMQVPSGAGVGDLPQGGTQAVPQGGAPGSTQGGASGAFPGPRGGALPPPGITR